MKFYCCGEVILNEAIQIMTDEIVSILADNRPTIYLFGSVALDDFQLGWSDIDIAILTEREITEQQADILVGLRQAMFERYPGNPYFRLFEGGNRDGYTEAKGAFIKEIIGKARDII